MPPVQTRRQSQSRKGKRTSHFRAHLVSYNLCPRCHNPKLPHHVCPTCGYYRGREVLPKQAEGGE